VNDLTPQPDDRTAVIKHLCAELGINTVTYADADGETRVEIDVIHVASLIEAGVLPGRAEDHPPFIEFARRYGVEIGGAS
jgi:anti-sigma regulatory factor (Ser/Thr protein kinase)